MDGVARSVGLCLALWRSGKHPCGLGGYLPGPSRHFSLKGQAAAPSSSHPYGTEVQGGDCGFPHGGPSGKPFQQRALPQVLWGLLVIHPEWQNPAKAGVWRKEPWRMGRRIGGPCPVFRSTSSLSSVDPPGALPCPALLCRTNILAE